jgi:hypothetical protein
MNTRLSTSLIELASQRDIYYRDAKLFGSQKVVDTVRPKFYQYILRLLTPAYISWSMILLLLWEFVEET